MGNKEFNKRFEELLNEIFGDNQKQLTPMDGFFKGLKTDNFLKEFEKDGLFTKITFILNPIFQDNEKDSIKLLKKQLDKCIKNQDFEEAAKLRDKIKEIENGSSKIVDLKKELEIAIQEQNFERAIEIRDELKKIN